MLAGFHSINHHFAVPVVRGTEYNGIYVLVFQQPAIIGICPDGIVAYLRVLSHTLCDNLLINITDRRAIDILHFQEGPQIGPAHAVTSYHPDMYCFAR
jgi:hypothetical protein